MDSGVKSVSAEAKDAFVAEAKELLAKRANRIRLDDLIAAETRALVQAVEEADLSMNERWDDAEFRRRISVYEGISERLVLLMGLLGRWGCGAEVDSVANAVMAIGGKIEATSGLTAWLNLSLYPCVLVVSAYGIGSTRARRWNTARRLLSWSAAQASEGQHSDVDHRVVDRLYAYGWKGNDNGVWQRLEGKERHKTALSDHLFELFAERWSESFVGVVPDFEELNDTWEMLAALLYCERYSEQELTDGLLPNARGNYVPVGRFAWRTQSRRHWLNLVAQSELKTELLEAGFSAGDGDHLAVSVANVERVSSPLGW